MQSSDDEAEAAPTSVSNYRFEDESDNPVSFAVLPLQEDAGSSSPKRQFSMHGTVDNGLQKVCKQVVAWKYDLTSSASGPVVSVLSREGVWFELEAKPVKWYAEETARSILVTLGCLHFMTRNPEASPKSIWDHLAKVFSVFEVKPNQRDLVDHMDLIAEAVRKDASLSKSKFLLVSLEEKPDKTMLYNEGLQSKTLSEFIVDDVEDYDYEIGVEEDEAIVEEDVFDSVCAFCDNGGILLCCDGVCMRSFHAIAEPESHCEGLGLTKDEVDAIQNFVCKNCEYKQHQCYACGKLGTSDKSCGAEVFRCANATCGHFYHPRCIAKLLHEEDEVAAEELQKNIAKGEIFTCTIHRCAVCHRGENKKETELQFAVCRRCPTSYHRKCIPREIRFAKKEGEGEEQEQEQGQEQEQEQGQEQEQKVEEEEGVDRAWENLLPHRILMYCLKHEIIEELGTPLRDHARFPEVEDKKKRHISELPAKRKSLLKKRKLDSESSFPGKKLVKESEQLSSAKRVKITKQSESSLGSRGKVRTYDASGKSLREKKKSLSTGVAGSQTRDRNNPSLGSRLFDYLTDTERRGKHETADSEPDKSEAAKTTANKLKSKAASLDVDSKRRILTLMKESGSSITLEDVLQKYRVPSTHAYSSKNVVDKTITLGKVEGAVEAVRTALKKLENNCSVDDAKAVCEPEVVNQIFKWQSKLKVYLSPFLHGTRYTSFGRHFTKVEKLEEIVNMLHWYVQSGDMIVDFCCGANDFSWILTKKLEEMGKKCLFKNYDVFRPKNDFNFEKRDWMTVEPHELGKEGKPLIMGLNPPFGVKAALANKFINKALQFKPQLLILIVPPETERLDKKDPPYDLVWENDRVCSGKSFYLPGSLDVNDKQMDQWNLTAPVLYLWSRRDCTAKYKGIAQKQGHLSKEWGGSNVEDGSGRETLSLPIPTEGHKASSSQDIGDRESKDSHGSEKNKSHGTAKYGEEMPQKGRNDDHGRPLKNGCDKEIPRHSPSDVLSGRSSGEGRPSRSYESAHSRIGENALQPIASRLSVSDVQHRVTYGGSPNIREGMSSSYSMNNARPYSRDLHRMSGDANHEEQYRSYLAVLEREPELRPPSDLYGRDPDPFGLSNYSVGHDAGVGQMGFQPSTNYGPMGAASVSSYRTSMSAMQRYAPQLDELNVTRTGPFGSETPVIGGSGFYDHGPPQPGYHSTEAPMIGGSGFYDPRPPQPGGYQPTDSMNFAPGPRRLYSHPHNSAGWLND